MEKCYQTFQKHQQSAMHKQAVEVMIVLPSTTKDVSELPVTQLSREKEHNGRIFLKIVSSIRFLSRQGMVLRGDKMMKTAIFFNYSD